MKETTKMKITITKKQEIVNDVPQEPDYYIRRGVEVVKIAIFPHKELLQLRDELNRVLNKSEPEDHDALLRETRRQKEVLNKE